MVALLNYLQHFQNETFTRWEKLQKNSKNIYLKSIGKKYGKSLANSNIYYLNAVTGLATIQFLMCILKSSKKFLFFYFSKHDLDSVRILYNVKHFL